MSSHSRNSGLQIVVSVETIECILTVEMWLTNSCLNGGLQIVVYVETIDCVLTVEIVVYK